MNKEKRVLAFLVIVVIVWGLNVVMVKHLALSVHPLQLSAFRITLASLLLVPLVFWKTGINGFKLHRKAIIPTLALGFSSIFIHQTLLTYGLQQTNASLSGLILGLNPLTTSLLAAIFLKESFTLKRALGVLIGFTGVLFVIMSSGKTSFQFGFGEWLMLGAMLAYVVGGLFVKVGSRYTDVIVITAYSHLFASVLLMISWTAIRPASIPWLLTPPSWTYLGILLLSAWVATALCTIWWNNGIQIIGAARTAMFINVLPLTSLVSAAIFLNEKVHWIHFFAFFCIVIGVYLGTRPAPVKVISTTIASSKLPTTL